MTLEEALLVADYGGDYKAAAVVLAEEVRRLNAAAAAPVQRTCRPAFIREHGHPDVVRGDAVPLAPGQRVELVLWADMEDEVERAVAAEREHFTRWQTARHAMLHANADGAEREGDIERAKTLREAAAWL